MKARGVLLLVSTLCLGLAARASAQDPPTPAALPQEPPAQESPVQAAPDVAPETPAPAAPDTAAAKQPATDLAAPRKLQPLSRPKPEIPDELCQRRLTGWVDLDYVVLPDGSVSNVTATNAQPKDAFESAAAGAVAKWTYPPQEAPVKMHLRLPMTFADCRSEQRRIVVPTSVEGINQADCPEIAAAAVQLGYRFEPGQTGRAVLKGESAQIYSAPRPRCFALGKTFRPGTRLMAWMEFEAFSLVSPVGVDESLAVWVWSHQLADRP